MGEDQSVQVAAGEVQFGQVAAGVVEPGWVADKEALWLRQMGSLRLRRRIPSIVCTSNPLRLQQAREVVASVGLRNSEDQEHSSCMRAE